MHYREFFFTVWYIEMDATQRITFRFCSRINLRHDFRVDFPFGAITSAVRAGAVGCPLASVLSDGLGYD